MKIKITLLILILINILHLSRFEKEHYVQANTEDYINNIFQMCKYQDQTNNLFLGDSIFNLDSKSIGLHNSLCLKKTSTNHLSIALKYNIDIFNLDFEKFVLNVSFSNKDNPDNKLKIFETFYDFRDFDYYFNNKLDITIKDQYLILTIDTSSLGEHFIFHGVDQEDYFYINIDSQENLFVEEFLLIDYENSYSLLVNYKDLYTRPERGNYQNTSIKRHNQTLSLICDVNNPISIDKLLNNIKAYDYSNNCEVEVSYEDITYLDAINNKKLGKYYLNLLATSSENITSILKVEIEIKDLYAPMINLLQEGDSIKIPLSSCESIGQQIDLNDYIIITDNYDNNLQLTKETQYFTYQDLSSKNVTLSVEDSSKNRIDKEVAVRVYDDIYPTITCEEKIIVHPYQYKNAEEVIQEYVKVEDNINVKSMSITDDTFSINYKNIGLYSFKLIVEDEEGNITSKTINISIESFQGPVFFVCETNLTIMTKSKYISAREMYAILVNENKIKYKQYRVIEYANDVYNQNYQKEGTYQVLLACYDDNYQKEYIKIDLNITKEHSKSIVFTKIGDFIRNIISEIKKFFLDLTNKIINWFKK